MPVKGLRLNRKGPGDLFVEPPLLKALSWVICASVLGISLIVSVEGRDPFRLPKELLLLAESITIASLILIGLIMGQFRLALPLWKEPVILIPSLVVTWTCATTFLSTNPALSWSSFVHVASVTIFFVATVFVAQFRGIKMLVCVIAGGALNAVIYLFQALGIWNPFSFVDGYRLSSTPTEAPIPLADTGFIGNANDLAAYFLPIFVVSLALSVASKRGKWKHVTVAALVGTSLVLSGSLTGVATALIVSFVMVALSSRKAAASLALAFLAVSGLAYLTKVWRADLKAVAYPQQHLEFKIDRLLRAVQTGDAEEVLRGRLPAYEAALAMFRDRPIVGVGPGTFAWNYYEYRANMTDSYEISESGDSTEVGSFREVHNDHLEILAETGLPGFALLIGALLCVGGISISKRHDDSTNRNDLRVATLALLPLSVGLAVIALFLYPLQLSSSLLTTLFIVGVCVSGTKELNLPLRVSSATRDAALPFARVARWTSAVLTGLVAALSIYVWCIQDWRCNTLSKRMEAAMHALSRGDPAAGRVLIDNLDNSQKCLLCTPDDANLPIVVATTLTLLNRPTDALSVYDATMKRQRRPEYYFNRAVLKLRTRDMDGAVDDYAIAVRFSPALLDRINDANLRKSVQMRASSSPIPPEVHRR